MIYLEDRYSASFVNNKGQLKGLNTQGSYNQKYYSKSVMLSDIVEPMPILTYNAKQKSLEKYEGPVVPTDCLLYNNYIVSPVGRHVIAGVDILFNRDVFRYRTKDSLSSFSRSNNVLRLSGIMTNYECNAEGDLSLLNVTLSNRVCNIIEIPPEVRYIAKGALKGIVCDTIIFHSPILRLEYMALEQIKARNIIFKGLVSPRYMSFLNIDCDNIIFERGVISLPESCFYECKIKNPLDFSKHFLAYVEKCFLRTDAYVLLPDYIHYCDENFSMEVLAKRNIAKSDTYVAFVPYNAEQYVTKQNIYEFSEKEAYLIHGSGTKNLTEWVLSKLDK